MISLWILLITYLVGRGIGELTLYEKDNYIFWTTLLSWASLPMLLTTHVAFGVTAALSVASWKIAILTTPIIASFTLPTFQLLVAGLATGIINTWLTIVKESHLSISLSIGVILSIIF